MKGSVFLRIAAALCVAPTLLWAQTPEEDFQQSCAMCHAIGGGPLAGPDLAGMSERRERSWLIRFIVEPQAVIDGGDSAAQDMVEQFNGMVMPASPGMTPARAAALIDYVAGESGGASVEESSDTRTSESEAPFAAEEVETGRKLFRGDRQLEAGGASCLSCHQVSRVGWLGGGALGPDLTDVYGRLGGRQGLTAWLSAPPTPSMSTLYRDHPLSEEEVRALTAFFADRAEKPSESSEAGRTQFVWFGLAGTAALLFLFERIWRNRFRGVRRRIIHTPNTRGVQ
jgi:cytochrome c2